MKHSCNGSLLLKRFVAARIGRRSNRSKFSTCFVCCHNSRAYFSFSFSFSSFCSVDWSSRFFFLTHSSIIVVNHFTHSADTVRLSFDWIWIFCCCFHLEKKKCGGCDCMLIIINFNWIVLIIYTRNGLFRVVLCRTENRFVGNVTADEGPIPRTIATKK